MFLHVNMCVCLEGNSDEAQMFLHVNMCVCLEGNTFLHSMVVLLSIALELCR